MVQNTIGNQRYHSIYKGFGMLLTSGEVSTIGPCQILLSHNILPVPAKILLVPKPFNCTLKPNLFEYSKSHCYNEICFSTFMYHFKKNLGFFFFYGSIKKMHWSSLYFDVNFCQFFQIWYFLHVCQNMSHNFRVLIFYSNFYLTHQIYIS